MCQDDIMYALAMNDLQTADQRSPKIRGETKDGMIPARQLAPVLKLALELALELALAAGVGGW